MRRKPSRTATFSSREPGSVMAIKRSPTLALPTAWRTRSKKYCLKMFGSSVEPDLLDTIKRDFLRSSLLSSARMCAGSVESRTWSAGNPSIVP